MGSKSKLLSDPAEKSSKKVNIINTKSKKVSKRDKHLNAEFQENLLKEVSLKSKLDVAKEALIPKKLVQVPHKRKITGSDSETSSSSTASLTISLKKKKENDSSSTNESSSSDESIGSKHLQNKLPKKLNEIKGTPHPLSKIVNTKPSSEGNNFIIISKCGKENITSVSSNYVPSSTVKTLKKATEKIYTSESEEENLVEAFPKNSGTGTDKGGSAVKVGKTNTTDCFFEGWSKNEILELLERVSLAIPKNDTLKYNSRVEKLDWEKVKFEPYDAIKCKEKWKSIEKRLRGYRVLKEMLLDAKDWLEKPWTDFYRSGKKNRHPDLPKRPLTSFMLFYLKKKKKYGNKHPGLEMTALSKIIAEKYKNLPEGKREKYNALALSMREEYKEKMQKFLEDHPDEMLKRSKLFQAKKQPGMPGPSKPIPPFKLFVEDKLKQHQPDPNFHSTEFLNECKNKWKVMSSKKKMPWIRWAHENEVKYLDEIKLYKAENPNFEVPNFKSILSKDDKIILDRMQGKPEKPPNSAYSLFSRVMLKDSQLKKQFETPKERMQEIAKIWKELPKIDRQMYSDEAKRMIDSYKMEYAAYLDSLSEEQREEELANNLLKRKPKVDGADKKPKRNLKQTKMKPKAVAEESEDEEFSTSLLKKRDVFSREPAQPPKDAYLLFKEKYMSNGQHSEEKAEKAWKKMSNKEKEKYKLKLEDLKQKYFINYKSFLTSLNPEELKAYTAYNSNPMVAKEKDDDSDSESGESSSSSSSSSSESEEKEEETSNKKAESSDSSSSSSDESESY